jgi:molybdopterin-guanine dinucleotide biosynthesis protein A
VIPDSFTDLGPYGAILSAFRYDPTAAWLVLACDLPLFDKAAVAELVSARSPRSVATALRLNSESFPEPLVAIWEPKSYQLLLAFLGQGVSCPRKVLINSDVFLKDASRPEVLINVNSREEAEEIRTKYPDLFSAG